LVGLGIVKPTITSDCSYQAFQQLTTLVEAIAFQNVDSLGDPVQLRKGIHNQNRIRHNQDADLLFSFLTAMYRVGQRKGFFLLAVCSPH